MCKVWVGRTIIGVGKDWIQLDSGEKIYIDEEYLC